MKENQLCAFGLFVLVMVAFTTGPAEAQTSAPGPYYATPSWDQILPASTRFIVLSNWNGQAVLDRETGLVWHRMTDHPGNPIGPFKWNMAQGYCNNLTVGNRKGWRLPSLQELLSLVDVTVPFPGPALPPGNPFGIIVSGLYWTATSHADNTDLAWFVHLGGGEGSYAFKQGAELYAWCVRGGAGGDPQ